MPISSRRDGVALLAVSLVFTAFLVGRGSGHDYIQFHAAARLLANGESPYGRDGQTRVQRDLRGGLDLRQVEPDDLYAEIGILPYFYPPWVALTVVPLTALAYPVAKAVWVFLGTLAVVVSGYAFASMTTPRRHPALTLALSLAFMPAFSALEIGQVAPFVLGLIVLVWRLTARSHDFAAGLVLAWLSVKPQLSVVVVPAVLVWAARRRRWRIVLGFAGCFGVLSLGSAALLPDWPWRMIAAPREFPLPTSIDPSVGVTWLTFCQSLGVRGPLLAVAYATAALPAVGVTFRASWDRETSIEEVLARGTLAAFFVAPYALGYDLTTLLFPLMAVVSKVSRCAGNWLIAAAIILPFWTLSAVRSGVPQVVFFWMPVALAWVWFARDHHDRSRLIHEANPGS